MALISLERPQNVTPAPPRLPFTERGALRLFVRRESWFSDLRDGIVAVARRAPREPLTRAPYFRREENPLKQKYGGPSASLSVVFHCAAVALLVYLPRFFPARVPPTQDRAQAMQTIYYRIPISRLPKASQPISPAASHRRAPRSTPVPARAPQLPAPPKSSLASIVSKPARPDNFRQTIYQSAAPPDLIIKTDQKLPNIVILQRDQPTLSAPITPSYAKPAAIALNAQAGPAPIIADANSLNASGAMLQLTDSHPKLTIPTVGGGAPAPRDATSGQGSPSSPPDLVVVGVDPSDATDQVSLPNGNRWGEFSIAPPAQTGTSREGIPGSSNDKNGKGNDGEAAGGNHGISAASGPVDIAGTANGASGLLSAALAVNLVYPVAQPIYAVRRNTMVISTGSIGGGGLNIYGALRCGKIYSIFLPMPGRNWSLQYCDKSSLRSAAAESSKTQVLHLDPPLVPPDVDLNHRYNFKRMAVPPPDANRPIILKGVIEPDGTVQKLTVYRGVSAEMDEAARIAFGRWRFKPAMRDGKPVAVDILVGIPPITGEDYVNR